MLQSFCYAGLGRAQSQEFTAFACAVEGFDLGEDGLANELILGRHHLCVQCALQALLRLNARPAKIINYYRITIRYLPVFEYVTFLYGSGSVDPYTGLRIRIFSAVTIRCQQKDFFAYLLPTLRTLTLIFKANMSLRSHKTVKFGLIFLLANGRIRLRTQSRIVQIILMLEA